VPPGAAGGALNSSKLAIKKLVYPYHPDERDQRLNFCEFWPHGSSKKKATVALSFTENLEHFSQKNILAKLLLMRHCKGAMVHGISPKNLLILDLKK
jgi:hypothetical protein